MSDFEEWWEGFAGLPHRCEFVRHLQGVHWVNDSKGTNVGATKAALSSLSDTRHVSATEPRIKQKDLHADKCIILIGGG